ncbi:MAG: hemerythrin domain-containing protein [Prevotellaceae bacterium]|jgi:regulator of cell morphogenesis and NO signaling|nr:hemerythrin domain-containing protein [Prevotellaceae bacterium]
MYEIDTNISGTSKLTNVIIEHPNVLNVLEYFNIPLGLGDKTIAEVAKEYNIAPNTLEVVIKIYCRTMPNKILNKKEVHDLLLFLQTSHNNFKLIKIPELKCLIENFSKEIPTKYGQMLVAFFDEYIQEIDEHFMYEDKKVFPYISNILNDKITKNFKIKEFERNHTDIGHKLFDLKNILIKYIPPTIVSEYRKQILNQLISLERDLMYHTQLEDNILVPFVKNMETNIKKNK